MTRARGRILAVLLALATLAPLSSCAYYNTFYLARKYYFRGTDGQPYPVEKTVGNTAQNFNKSVDYSKKVIANYPKSKWVDDAYLLWARALLGRDDPRQTINMLTVFDTRFPDSPLKDEALFYLGVAQRQAFKYHDAEKTLAQFLERAPKHDLAPYAFLERARALTAVRRHDEAAESAGQVLERFPKSTLAVRARSARAEALFSAGDFAGARQDFHVLGLNSTTDEERLTFLLREADCLEGARDYDGALRLLQDQLSYETRPTVTTAANGVTTVSGSDRYGRIRMRIGTAHLLAGRLAEALEAYEGVQADYPKTPLAAEAQYRVAYAYETTGDDFERARAEYPRVREQFGSSAFVAQAQTRLTNLERLAKFREGGGADSLEKRVEADFMLAEQYLFQLERPERALEEYRRIAAEQRGTPWEAKALTAQAWVLSRRLEQRTTADSLLWVVVREHPATEAQLAARDYLEAEGQVVPADLIKLPERRLPEVNLALTPPPQGSPALNPALTPASNDSLLGARRRPRMNDEFPAPGPPPPLPAPRAATAPDTSRTVTSPTQTPPRATARPDTARSDSTKTP